MYRPTLRWSPGLGGRLLWLISLSLVCLVPRLASAWIETEVRGHQATLLVDPKGATEVRHELLLRVRGGPLQSLEIEGMGQEAELLGDGTVRPITRGSSQLWPLQPELRQDGVLLLGIGAERGLRGGVYRFEFGYRLDLMERGWLERKGDRVRITWVQPRFSAGIDSAKVLFRVPRAGAPPALPQEEGPAAAVLLNEVRRGAALDEVELVRAHVAKGEPAVWQLDVSASALDGLTFGQPLTPTDLDTPSHPPRRILLPPTPWWMWIVGGAVSLFYMALLGYKFRGVQQNCQEAGVSLRPLIPLPPVVRIFAAGLLLGVTVALGLSEWPTAAGACLAGALLLAALLPPLRQPKARGPGEWVRLSEAELARPPRRVLWASWLDAGSLKGAGLLVGIVAVTVGVASALLPRSPYHAGLVLASVTAWLPLFLTGRASDMPADAAWGALPLYRWFTKKLAKHNDVTFEYWARRPLQPGALRTELDPEGARAKGAEEERPCDEIRLRLVGQRTVAGLRALEVGVEIGGGLVAMPCVVVRVDDESPAYFALPRTVQWMRGRHGEERVAILRPRVPSRALCLQLVTSALRLMSGASRTRAPGLGTKPRSEPSRAVAGAAVFRKDLDLPTV